MLTPEYLRLVSDAIAKVRLQTKHSDCFQECAKTIEQSVWDSRDKLIHKHMASVAENLMRLGAVDALHTNMLFPAVRGLELLATSRREDGRHFRTLWDFCRFFNVEQGGPWNALVHPAFAEVYELAYKTRKTPEYNVYADGCAQLFVYGNGNNQPLNEVHPRAAAGFVRISVKTRGAVASLAGSVVVDGVARRGEGLENGSWSVPSVLLSGDAEYFLSADTEGDICLSVKNVTLPGSYSAGDVEVWGYGPEGRL